MGNWESDDSKDLAAYFRNPRTNNGRIIVKWLPQAILDKVDAIMRPMLEQWTALELKLLDDRVGVREYQTGAQFISHVEPKNIVSASVVVVSEGGWKIQIKSRSGETISIEDLEENKMMFYAGA